MPTPNRQRITNTVTRAIIQPRGPRFLRCRGCNFSPYICCCWGGTPCHCCCCSHGLVLIGRGIYSSPARKSLPVLRGSGDINCPSWLFISCCAPLYLIYRKSIGGARYSD